MVIKAMRRIRRKARKSKKTTRRMVRSTPRNNFLSTKRFLFPLILSGSDIVSSGTGGVGFYFSDIPGYTDFTNTFDAYRLCGVRFRWVIYRDPTATGNSVTGTSSLHSRVMWAYDYNDITSPGSFAELQQYNNAKEIYLTAARPVSKWYFFKPRDLTLVASGYAQKSRSNWIRMNETSVLHYGLKYAYDGNQGGVNPQQIRLEAYYYFQLKSVK